jgi:hypothetical protein
MIVVKPNSRKSSVFSVLLSLSFVLAAKGMVSFALRQMNALRSLFLLG